MTTASATLDAGRPVLLRARCAAATATIRRRRRRARRRGAAGRARPRGPAACRRVVVVRRARRHGPAGRRVFGDPTRSSRSSASPAPTARPRPPTCSRRSSTPRAPRGLIGTVGARIGGDDPRARLHDARGARPAALLRRDARRRRQAVAMEVSSHALDQRRVDGTRFAAVVFTNLTRTTSTTTALGLLRGQGRLFDRLRRPRAPRSTSTTRGAGGCDAELALRRRRRARRRGHQRRRCARRSSAARARRGARFTLRTPRGALDARAAAASAASTSTTCSCATSLALAARRSRRRHRRRLAALPGVPGRFERRRRRSAASRVIVDYAHTPDALERCCARPAPLAPRPAHRASSAAAATATAPSAR